MALLEELQRKVHKYGLVPKLIKNLPFISFFCALLGALWIFYLPTDGHYRGTYISENALMPSQAYSYYRESEWNFLRGYRDEISKMTNLSSEERNLAIKQLLVNLGFSVSVQEYDNNSTSTGANVYGVLNAPRGDGTESMALVAPWFTTDDQWNINGVSLVIALARYFTRWTVWSKNIIIVFPENNNKALRSWVKAYHSSLDLTAGSIESALVIEYPGTSDYLDYLGVSYEGVNGQLPNLDLLNTVVSVAQHEGITVSLQGISKDNIAEDTYFNRLTVLLRGIKELTLAGLKVSNGCEVFSGYRIQAVTLKALGEGGVDITTLGRVVEALFRSVNNLLEKFHQSFFFYLMLGPKLFISIGTYLPSAVLFSASYALGALSEVLNCGLKINDLFNSLTKVFIIFFAILSSSAIFGSILLYLPVSSSVIYYGLLANGLLLSTAPTKQLILANVAGIIGKANKFNPAIFYASTAYLLHAVSLLYLSLLLTSILVVHFSLAYALGLCMLPLSFVRPISIRSHKYQESINSVCLILSCPWFVVFIVGLIDADFSNGPTDVMAGLLSAWKNYDCWTWFILIIGWLPSWLSTVMVGSVIIDESEYGIVDLKKDI